MSTLGSVALALLSGLISSLLLDRSLALFGMPGELEPLVAHLPNVSEMRRQTEFAYRFETNSRGLRYPEIPMQKPPGERRILVLGDSFTEGHGVAADETFAARLAAERPGVAFLNAGLAGTGPIHYGRLLLQLGFDYQPDGVLICLFANDVANTSPNLTPRDFAFTPRPRDGRARLLHAGWPHIDTLVHRWLGQREDRRRKFTSDFTGDIGRKALEMGIPSERIEAWRSALPRDLVAAVERGELPGGLLSTGLLRPGYWLQSLDLRNAVPSWNAMAGLLSHMVDQSRRRDIEVGVVFIPSQLQYDPRSHSAANPLIATGTRVRSAWLTGQSEYQRRLHEWARSRSVELLDLTPVLRGAIRSSERLNWPVDGHWTPAGHRVAAAAIGRWLREEQVFAFLDPVSPTRAN